jgi:hypothetical protein
LSAASSAHGRSSHRNGSKSWDDITLPASRIWDRRKSFYRRIAVSIKQFRSVVKINSGNLLRCNCVTRSCV